MRPNRLRAPSKDASILQVPPLEAAGGLVEANRRSLDRWSTDIQGRSADVLRRRAREEVVTLARLYHQESGLDPVPADATGETIIATGHQPELFHPGVWIKNFAAANLARRAGGIGLNLIVDNDVPKGAFLRVPARAEGGSGLIRKVVEFDSWPGEVPFEDQPIVDRALFESFGDRLGEPLRGLVPDPLIHSFWPLVQASGEFPAIGDNVGLRFARARRLIEARWGARNMEVPLGRLCGTDAFLWFASHLLANLERFRSTHNQALDAYRRVYGIRSKNHPVAALRLDDAWQEAPFWAWRAESPRRHPLWVRQRPGLMDLRIGGEDRPFLELPLGPDREACCAVEALRDLPKRGIRLRTRALTTTMFARLFLSDLFLHGIGGAKYDELGDEIIRGFFHLEPPRFLTLTLTLRAGLPSNGATEAKRLALLNEIRDLEFNPDRHPGATESADWNDLVLAKRQAIDGPVDTHRQRVDRFHAIRRVNEALQPSVSEARQRLADDSSKLADDLRREAVARSREYASVVHSEERLRRTLTAVGSEVPAP